MSTLSDLVVAHGRSTPEDIEWLHLLVGDCQLLADLAFADIVLWVPTEGGFIAVAHSRPSSAATLFYRDSAVGKVGRQMQTWVRTRDGWRIAAAHVSVIDEPE